LSRREGYVHLESQAIATARQSRDGGGKVMGNAGVAFCRGGMDRRGACGRWDEVNETATRTCEGRVWTRNHHRWSEGTETRLEAEMLPWKPAEQTATYNPAAHAVAASNSD